MKPFLKWAGNKFNLLAQIKTVLPSGQRLIEPFAGSGALFLNTNYSNYLLADSNADLIQLYTILKKQGQGFIDYCKTFFIPENNQAENFYKLRNLFNQSQDPYQRAALFVYLNKHCFNGLCRYNSQGFFNVPFGRYKKNYFPEAEMQFFYHKAQMAEFMHAEFATIMQTAEKGDVIYCDPPYVPWSSTANFTSYASRGFNNQQQQQLSELAEKLAKDGITVVISNHYTDFTRTLYQNAKLISFPVQRFISCNGAKRSKVEEVLAVFTEINPCDPLEMSA